MNFSAVITRKDAAQFYWPPFVSAVERGRVASIMCSCVSLPSFLRDAPALNSNPNAAEQVQFRVPRLRPNEAERDRDAVLR